MIGYIPMTADLFHIGHLRALEQAYKLCDNLIVGLIECPSYKKTIIPYKERKEIIEAMGYDVVKQTSINPNSNLKKYKVDILFSGDGFEEAEIKACEKLNITMRSIKYYKKQTTTKIKEKICNFQTQQTSWE